MIDSHDPFSLVYSMTYDKFIILKRPTGSGCLFATRRDSSGLTSYLPLPESDLDFGIDIVFNNSNYITY